ncbi:hypothetical protein GCM10027187_08750 [Streptosporangium sandarakinum]|nr:hypothetical protein [Streptosporangium sandarakinum]
MPCLADGSVWRDPDGSYGDAIGEFGLYDDVCAEGSSLLHSGLTYMMGGRKAAYRND